MVFQIGERTDCAHQLNADRPQGSWQVHPPNAWPAQRQGGAAQGKQNEGQVQQQDCIGGEAE
jgi:hypothetical protein